MAEQKGKANPRHKRHKKYIAPVPTPEQLAAAKAAQDKIDADYKAEQERLRLYSASVEKMSHRQLSAELRKTVKREYAGKPSEPQAGLTIAFATILGAVLSNTRSTPVTDDGRRLRRDQINPNSLSSMNPGW